MQSKSRKCTPPHQVSSSSDLDRYLTPEHIIRQLHQQKHWAKCLSVNTREAKLRSQVDNSTSQAASMPLLVVPLLEKGIEYRQDELSIDEHPELAISFLVCSSEATSFVQKWAKKYLEAVVMFDDVWFLITSFDVFWHQRHFDDCADGFATATTDHSYALVRTKNQHGKYFCELSIFLGDIELLAVGGFYANDASSSHHGFLGSSVPNLPAVLRQGKSSTAIFARELPCQYGVSNRHIRQYAKQSALNNWSYHSRRFLDKGFYPVNPLALADRQDLVPAKSRDFNVMASYYLNCAAEQHIDKEDVKRLLNSTLQHKMF